MKQTKILIVDDQPETIDFVTSIIEDMGDYTVLSARDGEEGVLKARAEVPDLIILDVMMPKKDGYTAFCELKQDEKTSRIPVIMFSSLSELGEMVRAQALSLTVTPELFVDKPIKPALLKELIHRVLNPEKVS
jgi:CheY-like chemotaxis protein